MLRALLLTSLYAACWAADAPPATPAPPTAPGTQPLDPATSHRAEAAADAYLKAQADKDVRPTPEAEHDLATAEVDLLEAQTFLDQHQPFKAGDRYLEASKLLTGIAADQRALLDGRMRKASTSLTALSRRLLEEQAFNLGTQDPANPADAH
jgi:hypothetical protein